MTKVGTKHHEAAIFCKKTHESWQRSDCVFRLGRCPVTFHNTRYSPQFASSQPGFSYPLHPRGAMRTERHTTRRWQGGGGFDCTFGSTLSKNTFTLALSALPNHPREEPLRALQICAQCAGDIIIAHCLTLEPTWRHLRSIWVRFESSSCVASGSRT